MNFNENKKTPTELLKFLVVCTVLGPVGRKVVASYPESLGAHRVGQDGSRLIRTRRNMVKHGEPMVKHGEFCIENSYLTRYFKRPSMDENGNEWSISSGA